MEHGVLDAIKDFIETISSLMLCVILAPNPLDKLYLTPIVEEGARIISWNVAVSQDITAQGFSLITALHALVGRFPDRELLDPVQSVRQTETLQIIGVFARKDNNQQLMVNGST
jgi:hypothetical protein